MILLNMSNPVILLLMLCATVLLIFLAQEIKKSFVAALVLFTYLGILGVHVFQICTLSEELKVFNPIISKCIIIDFIFVFISFLSYLWVDDIEAKVKGKKGINNSLALLNKKV